MSVAGAPPSEDQGQRLPKFPGEAEVLQAVQRVAAGLREHRPSLSVRDGQVVRRDTGGHGGGWAELWERPTGDGPQRRPTEGGTYFQITDPNRTHTRKQRQPPAQPLRQQFTEAPTHDRLRVEAAAVEPGRSVGAGDRYDFAMAMQTRGMHQAAASAFDDALRMGYTDVEACERGRRVSGVLAASSSRRNGGKPR
jgi:hypothetical protein